MKGSSLNICAMKPQDDLIDIKDLADYLKVPVATIYAWRYRGTGPPGLRIGRHVRYRLGDVEVWLESRLDGATRKP